MRLWRRVRSWVRAVLRRSRMESEMDAELRFHLEAYAEDLVRNGVPRQEAMRRARIEFGGIERAKEECRDARGTHFVESLLQDLRFALRMLRKNPGFTAVAVLTLALGIGANTAIFGVVNGVLLRPLPYQAPERLVRVFGVWPTQVAFPMNPADYIDYRDRNRVFEDIEVYIRADRDLTMNGVPRQLKGMQVTAGFRDLLGFKPVVGRTFRRDEENRDTNNVVVLSHHIWQDVFHGDPGIVGKGIRLSEANYTVIGVMPPGIQHVGGSFHSMPFGTQIDVWWPHPLQPINMNNRGSHYLNAIARIKPGVTIEQADAEMNRLAVQLEQEHPNYKKNARIRLVPLEAEIVGGAQPMILAMWAAVGFVLLIACVNVANLLSARAASRRREMAVRSAMGAGRLRLVRQMLAESLVLAAAGGALGTVLAYWGVDVLVALAPANLPRLNTVAIDFRVLGVTMVATILTGLLFGLVPAIEGLRVSPNDALKDGDRGSTAGSGRARLRGLLVTGEISLALVLLVGAGLLLRTFVALEQVDPGFRPAHVLTLTINPPITKYVDKKDDFKRTEFLERVEARIRQIPGVLSVGFSSDAPWTGYDDNTGVELTGRPNDPKNNYAVRYHFAGPGYFETIGVPLASGRYFTDADKQGAPNVVVVNSALARLAFSGEEAVGKQLDIWGVKGITIIGVAGDIKDAPGSPAAKPAFWWPDRQLSDGNERVIAIRTQQDPASIAQAVQREVMQLDLEVPVSNLKTLDEIAGAAISAPRYALVLASVFGGAALLLAAVGIYGVIAYSVTQRTQEFGIRIALGANRRDVLRLVLGQGTRLTLLGIGLGIVAAFVITRLMASLLYGISATDPQTFAAVALLLALVALAACYIPARRAMRVDPMVALRYE